MGQILKHLVWMIMCINFLTRIHLGVAYPILIMFV
jgi:hypothetical protein